MQAIFQVNRETAMTVKPSTPAEAEEAAAEYLDPERLRNRLTHIGFFLLAFELLRDYIIENTRTFFSDRWEFVDGDMKVHTTQDYQDKVLSLAKREFEAVLKWHVQMQALTDADVADILSLLDYRNTVAHEPQRILHDEGNTRQPDAVDRVRQHHRKIGNFWGGIEADTDPDFLDGKEIDYDGIVSGTTILLDFMALLLSEESSKERPKKEP
jgi:hypothetical protein